MTYCDLEPCTITNIRVYITTIDFDGDGSDGEHDVHEVKVFQDICDVLNGFHAFVNGITNFGFS